ncbi:MAG: Na+/H+-exchanging protein [Gemmatales bacterium]|nr:MAG: Na+/H+-exchanging protein [Gemmatales bacterium]
MSRFSKAPRRTRKLPRVWLWLLLIGVSLVFQYTTAWAAPAAAAEHAAGEQHSAGHVDPIAKILLAIALVLLLAKLAGDLFERLQMPAVLGELSVGILLGNFMLLTGSPILEFLHAPTDSLSSDPYSPGAILKMLAGIGVVLLLFEVGLESTVADMMSVGMSSLLVAVLGVITPFGLGWLVSSLIIPDAGWQVHVFIGATLCATSVGITARVLKDLGQSQRREAQIILGAAVIDDVLGLLVLAIVAGIIQQGIANLDVMGLLKIIVLAFGFLAGAVFLGTRLVARPVFKVASYLKGHGLLVVAALVVCFGFSWLASLVGLAPIVGAFAAGLILEKVHYRELGEKENHELEEALAPLTSVFVPIFFVQMGIQVDLRSFAEPSVWGLAIAITIAAILGKQACAFGVRESGLNTTAVGLGMIPRGEVGLIFADQGRQLLVNGLPVVDTNTYSATIVMVLITTMATPPLLKWALQRKEQKQHSEELAPVAAANGVAEAVPSSTS